MIDAHAHLTDAKFDEDREQAILRARAAGVARILDCGDDVGTSERALALARRHPDLIRVAVGIHPHRAASCDAAAIDALRALARHRLVVAIGEIGMDLSGRSGPLDAQRRAFGMQLMLAAELDLPVVVHLRDAHEEIVRALEAAAPVRGMLHSYSEGAGELDAWLARGLVPSFSGTVTFAKNAGLREAAARVPLDAILVETDAPYLAPEPRRGQRNEPARVADTYARVAGERGIPAPALVASVARNAAGLFGDRWR
ncbi:MAG TPA: TatD family hydrolase [Candidatus Limnocylindria bacterium]|nr:TatD family hydrolase [Candidatus Limnocylindria bacterium]